ncbi:exopolysaccharide biosynthesis polyprenyl glycosylphosphotransferase [Streptomyces sp. NPDC008313]|uniref:exopolysaccharide biosynthesis polyprenyl glycosylphosphotransferase n=1 Tax=Streptomyces sp. NPDC008313 TaxID=3364826 RepID=UPI0036E2F50A
MTAESTVPSPGGQPREHVFSPVSVIPAQGITESPGLPGGPRRPARRASGLPLLAAETGAALLAALVSARPADHPLLVLVLLLGVLALSARATLSRTEEAPAARAPLDELPAVCGRSVVAWCVPAALVAALDPAHALSAGALAAGCALQAAVGCAGRGAVHAWRRRTLVRHPDAALVIGPVGTARRVASAVLRHPRCGVRPVGIVSAETAGGEGLPVLTTGEEVQRALIQNSVRAVLVVEPHIERAPLLEELARTGCALWELDADTPSYRSRHRPPHDGGRGRLAGFPCRRLHLLPPRRGVGKRALDIVVSGALLLLISPVLLVCATVLRLSEGPGVVFRQERVGKDGRPFTLLKFRTHRPVDAHESATRWSVANEREMSRFCQFLRRSSLDELLQLWNVLRGDMSLVGPRPERPYFVAKFSQTHPGYAARHRMPTGITGLAQIQGLRGDTSIEDRCRFDNAYIDDWSLWQDVCILLRTAATLVRPTGS